MGEEQRPPTAHPAIIRLFASEEINRIVDAAVLRLHVRRTHLFPANSGGQTAIHIRIKENGVEKVWAARVLEHWDVRDGRVARLYLEVLDMGKGVYIIITISEDGFKAPVQGYTRDSTGKPDEIRALLIPNHVE